MSNIEIKQEFFDKIKFIDVSDGDTMWHNQSAKELIWNFISSKLNQVRKETAESLKVEKKRMSGHIFKTDKDKFNEGYNAAIKQLNTKIDEFIKSMEEHERK
jgi:CRISPR/Cas system CMR subunit Cmr6 (Cas7 group RAMP superfamily)